MKRKVRSRRRRSFRRPRNRVSRNDAVTHNCTFRYFETLSLDKSSTDMNFGLKDFRFTPLGKLTKEFFLSKADGYDRYRVSNIRVTATPGLNMDMDRRGQVNMFSRYDPSYNIVENDLTCAPEVLFASNTRHRNFGQSGRVEIISGTPKLKRTSGSSEASPLLPTGLQWYNTDDLVNTNLQNTWNIGQVLATIPKGYSGVTNITLIFTVTVAFKSRKGPKTQKLGLLGFNNDVDTQEEPPIVNVTFDDVRSLTDLRTGILTGLLHPVDLKNINVVNVGHTILGEELHDVMYRVNSSGITYKVVSVSDGNVNSNISA